MNFLGSAISFFMMSGPEVSLSFHSFCWRPCTTLGGFASVMFAHQQEQIPITTDQLCERVTDGARTRDLRSHNPMLYQLSYGHQA